MRWNITNVKLYIRPTRKNAINVIAAHVLTHRSENIYILCHCPYSLVPPNVRTFPSTFSPIRTFYTIALHEHVALFHALKLYSTDQFSFCLIRPDSIMCHFLVNNLRNRFRSPWSLCGSVVEHRSAESEGLRFDSSWGLWTFSFVTPSWQDENISLCFFTELKTYHLLFLSTNITLSTMLILRNGPCST